MNDKNFRVSGRNTIIHKNRKIDLLLVNGDHPVIIVSHAGIDLYKGILPERRIDAKRAHQELIDLSKPGVFGQEKTLVFIEALDNKEYKLDYSKINTKNFIKVHQENYI